LLQPTVKGCYANILGLTNNNLTAKPILNTIIKITGLTGLKSNLIQFNRKVRKESAKSAKFDIGEKCLKNLTPTSPKESEKEKQAHGFNNGL